ncbi:hypothetical protein ACI68E_001007 [Malassezia pachydermatis]
MTLNKTMRTVEIPSPEQPRLKRVRPSPPDSDRDGGRGPSTQKLSPASEHNGLAFSPSHRQPPRYVQPSTETYDLSRKAARLERSRATEYSDSWSPHAHPSLMQRRGKQALGRVSALQLSSNASTERSYGLDVDERRPSVHSAPPQQVHFGSDTRLPPPSYLFRASERDAREGGHDHDDLKRRTVSSMQPEMQGYLPTPGGTPRVFLPQNAALPSPAYHTCHIGQGMMQANMDRTNGAADTSSRTADTSIDGSTIQPKSPVNKMNFLSLFADFYDSLSDSRSLKATLEHQIRASNTLLQTLQRSSKVLEEAVDQRLQQETKAWETRLQRMESRLNELEARLSSSKSDKTLSPKNGS